MMTVEQANGIGRDGAAGIPLCDVTQGTLAFDRHAVTGHVTASRSAEEVKRLELTLARLPNAFAALLRAVDLAAPGSVMRAIDDLGGLEPLLDSAQGVPEGGSSPSVFDTAERARAIAWAVTDLRDRLLASRYNRELIYVTLTAPATFDVPRTLAEQLLPGLAAQGLGRGAWLALDWRDGDKRPSHTHGLLVVAKGEAKQMVDDWCKAPGVSPDAQVTRVVSGWGQFALRGSTGVLDRNLARIVAYCLKGERVRDPRTDVLASGVFEPWWFAALEGKLARHLGPSIRGSAAVPRPCAREGCSRTIPKGKATYCSAACRTAAYRARRLRDGTKGDSSRAVTDICHVCLGDADGNCACPRDGSEADPSHAVTSESEASHV